MRWRKFDPRSWKRSAREAIPDDNPPAALDRDALSAPHLALGQRGEVLAAEYLESAGYRLVASNFTLPVGRSLRGALVRAEIDLIAYEDATLCFIEVKTRRSDWFAAPEANVDLRKQRQITRAARVYRRLFGLTSAPYRHDVVSVILPPVDTNNRTPAPRLQLLRNFWTDERFRKRRWGIPPPDF
jgi:putative endonuclease